MSRSHRSAPIPPESPINDTANIASRASSGPRPRTLPKIGGLSGVSPHKAELALVYRRARESWGGTQEELAAKLGVQQRIVSFCESADHRETFNTVHFAIGPTEWALPIMSFLVVRVGAQITRAVEIQHQLHVARLAAVVTTTSGLTCEYAGAVAREAERWVDVELQRRRSAR